MIRKKHAILLLLLTIPLFLFAQEQAANQPMDRDGDNFSAISGLTRASQLLDYSIANREGDLSGSVRDIVIDANGTITFFAVDMAAAQASDTQTTTGGSFYLIPADRVSRSDDRQSLAFDLTRDELGSLSTTAAGDISMSGDVDVEADIEADASGDSTVAEGEAGAVGVQPNVGVAASRIYASELLSSTMVTDQNAELGVVEDVVINLRDRQVQYLALSPAGVLGIGEQYHAVPMRVFVGLDRNARQLIVQLRAENFARDEGFSPEGSWPLQASAQLGDISPRTEDDRTFFGFPDERTTDDDSNKTPGEDNGSSTSPAAEPEPDAQVNRSSDNEDDENATPAEEPTPPPAAEPDTRVNKFFDAEDDENATPAEEPTPPPAAEPDTRVNKFFDAEDDENN